MPAKEPTEEKKPAKQVVTSDDLYRHSSQYKLWSFTPEQLSQKRAQVNAAAKLIVMKRLRVLCDKPDNDYVFEESRNLVELVTQEEELKETSYYVGVLLKLCTSVMKLPLQVRATAVMFLKRFYLLHSMMEYHPKKLLSTCLFLAAKSENCFMDPKTLASCIGSKTTPESILELEFELVQTLSFTLLCHHPYRPLHGFFFDFQAVLINDNPKGVIVFRHENEEKTKVRLQITRDRITESYGAARKYIEVSLNSDAGFLFTPPQIALACFLKVDEELTLAYLKYKFTIKNKAEDKPAAVKKEEVIVKQESIADSILTVKEEDQDIKIKSENEEEIKKEPDSEKNPGKVHQRKLLKTIRECLQVIETAYNPTIEEATVIDKKVHYCINPSKLLKRKRQAMPGEESEKKRIKLEQPQKIV